jgi:nitroreductase
MDLIEAMTTVGTCRSFSEAPVPQAVLWKAIEAARFGPQGGNRQPVRFVVVSDTLRKARLGELYLEQWEPYLARLRAAAAQAAGRPEPPPRAGDQAAGADPPRRASADDFARAFGRHPAIVVVCAHLESLLATDAQLGRLSIVGGASVYPIVQNFMLALRDQGVASALTTLLCAREPEVRELLAIPPEYATACHIAVGYPAQGFPRRLRRRPVEELAFLDSFDGPPLREV